MPFVCKDYRCRSIAIMPVATVRHYDNGIKFCSICGRFMVVEGGRCPCCNTILRTKPHNRRDRRKYNVLY